MNKDVNNASADTSIHHQTSVFPPGVGHIEQLNDNAVTELNVSLEEIEFASAATGAQREKMAATPYDLFPFAEVVPAYCEVAEFGAKKYAPWNWTKGLGQVQIMCSLLRHLWAYMRGEDCDCGPRGSGLPHTHHILWNACALVHSRHHGIGDDRRAEPPREYKKDCSTI